MRRLMTAVVVLAFGVGRCNSVPGPIRLLEPRLTTRDVRSDSASAAAGACFAGVLTASQAFRPPPLALANVKPPLSALRLSGGGGKKREAPSPRVPGSKRVAAGVGAADAADPIAAEVEEEAPDTSRNWDVQKVASVRPVSSPCLRVRLCGG